MSFKWVLILSLALFILGCVQPIVERSSKDKENNLIAQPNQTAHPTPPQSIDMRNLTDEEIIKAIQENETLSYYRNWSFKVNWKQFQNDKLDVSLYAYQGDWERVNELRVWFQDGKIVDYRINPYVKTCEPFSLEEEEKKRTIELAFSDSEVRKTLEGKKFEITMMMKYLNRFNGEECASRTIYISINDSKETYVIFVEGESVTIENTTCPGDKKD